MDTISEGLQRLKVVSYIDDITVFLPTMEQHLLDLYLFFDWLAKANLKVKFTKCVLAQAKVKVLGHLFFQKRIKPNPVKVNTISQMLPPTSVAGVW